MCFSPAGSFTLAAVLTGAGAVSIARSSPGPWRMYAAVPFLFAAQQAAEGIVWLTIDAPNHDLAQRAAVLVFLGLALVVWPIWAPFSMRLVERDPGHKKMLTAFCWIGVSLSLTAGILLARWQPVASITGNSISYHYAGGGGGMHDFLLLLAYIVPTIGPFFVSTATLSRRIGATLIVSAALTLVIRREALTSVWCFFAAIVSCMIVLAVDRHRRGALVPVPS